MLVSCACCYHLLLLLLLCCCLFFERAFNGSLSLLCIALHGLALPQHGHCERHWVTEIECTTTTHWSSSSMHTPRTVRVLTAITPTSNAINNHALNAMQSNAASITNTSALASSSLIQTPHRSLSRSHAAHQPSLARISSVNI